RRDDWASVFAKIERELRSLLDRELIQSDQRKASSFTITPSAQIPQPAPASATVKTDLESAVALHRRGQLAEAEEIYRNILKVAPDHFDATHLLGVVLVQRGRLLEGEQLIARALKINPNQPTALNNRGNALRDLMRLEDALASYDKAVALKPD